ncbi:hypothetical protein [Brachybacterium nesterenkovii]|uniref:Hypothetical membrane protein n=1 Tax=Brachybacterium nesterenkovii TaxID=47847 RepID=A0A1X6WT91_9MICO|nr:hypothetical protein [Brachybacterium nesterenkovii]SLM88191.1 hypothetical membrane protein [Brachybacterium nesterenkovii]
MHIDFAALGLVAGVTLLACVALVTLVSLGARLLDAGANGSIAPARRAGGYAVLGLAGLLILFGLYLVIPAFHS